MAEVLMRFDTPIVDDAGTAYIARVCGRPADDGMWEGWIEFVPGNGRAVLRSARETKQPKRSDLVYWATGLTPTYLEGALERVLHPTLENIHPAADTALPAYDRPAASPVEARGVHTRPAAHAVLDPFSVYLQGEEVLREQLGALGVDHLRTIVRAHDLVGEDEVDLREMHHATLVDLIVAAVSKRTL